MYLDMNLANLEINYADYVIKINIDFKNLNR